MLYDALTRRADFAPPGTWTALYALWIAASTAFLLLRRLRPATALAWLLAFWTVPLLSAFGWFLFGPRRMDAESGRRRKAVRVAARVVPAPADRLPGAFVASSPFASLARVPRSGGDTEPVPRRAADVELYADGTEAYPALEAALAAARETINLEYYIWQPDRTGTRFRDLLAARARDGIEVRVVVDALGAKNCPAGFWTPLIEGGGEVRRFNPPRPLEPQPGRINFRTHRKIVVVDGRVAFTGGINMSDADTALDGPPWRDTHLRVEGAPALDVQAIFLEDWLYGTPVSTSAPSSRDDDPAPPAGVERWFPDLPEATGPWLQIVDSGPDEPTEDIHLLLFEAIGAARSRVWLTTPYFVPDEALLTALHGAASRGVDVRIMVPAQGDSRLVDAAAETYAREIAVRGARLFRHGPVMNHSKTLVVDDAFAIVGTANFDNRSFRLNFELVVAMHDEGLAGRVAAMFEADLERARAFDPEAEAQTVARRLLCNAAPAALAAAVGELRRGASQRPRARPPRGEPGDARDGQQRRGRAPAPEALDARGQRQRARQLPRPGGLQHRADDEPAGRRHARRARHDREQRAGHRAADHREPDRGRHAQRVGHGVGARERAAQRRRERGPAEQRPHRRPAPQQGAGDDVAERVREDHERGQPGGRVRGGAHALDEQRGQERRQRQELERVAEERRGDRPHHGAVQLAPPRRSPPDRRARAGPAHRAGGGDDGTPPPPPPPRRARRPRRRATTDATRRAPPGTARPAASSPHRPARTPPTAPSRAVGRAPR